ncbi:REP-associated tyrosine transposase [Opitutus terrae]|uniref:Transposase IS200-like domain-containing protein n=1 Tax=Opitutus terrae (strain DSM 11246 / JCM 15787 / PB90-1) TaxID=452637 RepID=B1ZQX2_OPITP|nr:hypothetical protein Oter_4599 [Opitutus terrae PB90-1]
METLPIRQRLFHAAPPWIKSGEIFFITLCCAERKTNSLAHFAAFSVIVAALEHYIRTNKLWAHLLLAMPDHLHALAAFPIDQRMDKVVRDWKRYTAKRAGILWQDGFFDHRLRSEESFELKVDYIRRNPVRAGLAASPQDWPYVWPNAVHGACFSSATAR